MISRIASLVLLAIFSSFSINLILQFGLSMGIAMRPQRYKLPFIKTAFFFATALVLWLAFSKMLISRSMGLLGYVMCFPAASLVYTGIKKIVFSIARKDEDDKGTGEDGLFGSHDDALAAASLFITLNLSGNFIEAVFLSAGFAAGFLLAVFILREIQYRSEMEAVPQFLRGSPLAVISMGLLSLIFGSAALLFFRAIGG
jgi:electron transport complex protein RnfA